jgi:hypothetical protein
MGVSRLSGLPHEPRRDVRQAPRNDRGFAAASDCGACKRPERHHPELRKKAHANSLAPVSLDCHVSIRYIFFLFDAQPKLNNLEELPIGG